VRAVMKAQDIAPVACSSETEIHQFEVLRNDSTNRVLKRIPSSPFR
jgi:hypothetical protein